MIRIMKVFLDLDEVLVSFNKGVYNTFHLAYKYEDLSPNYRYFGEIGQTVESVDEKCTIPFWFNLEWMHDGREIEEAVRMKFGSANVYLLTTPMPNSGSWTGKAAWVNEHLSHYNERLIVTPAPKSLLASPDTLLIDDKDENIEEFRAAGGQGILVSRPWNKAHARSNHTLEDVKHALEAYS